MFDQVNTAPGPAASFAVILHVYVVLADSRRIRIVVVFDVPDRAGFRGAEQMAV